VNALDKALRSDPAPPKHIENVKPRRENGGTEPQRVLVESRDTKTGDRWTTVGVSPNIIDASFEALLDSINYKLLKENALVG
jgi:2-isopropylmalate synthase